MKCIIFDETRGHVVNVCEVYDEIEEYGNTDAPAWYGDLDEAGRIMERLAEGTGHTFTVVRWD